jgi:hypothetical protein
LATPDALVRGVEDHHGNRVLISSAVRPLSLSPLSTKPDDVTDTRGSSASREVLIGDDEGITDVNVA